MLYRLRVCCDEIVLSHKASEGACLFEPPQIAELKLLRGKTPKDLWNEDMNAFLEELDVSLTVGKV